MSENVDIKYVAPRTVARFMASRALVRLIIGPFGSGKSTGSIMELLIKAQQQEPARDGIRRTKFAVIRNTYRELMDTAKETFESWIPHEIREWIAGESLFVVKFNDVECIFLFRALDTPDDVRKLLSLDLTGAWVNEAKQVPKAVLDGLTGRIGRYPNSPADGYCTWSGIIMDTNPPDVDHWIYKVFEEHKLIKEEDRSEYQVFHQPSGLAPDAENIENLLQGLRTKDGRPLYYARMMVGKSQEWINVFVHGRYGFISDAKPVYPEYTDEVHTVLFDLPWIFGAPLHLGMDFGLTPALVVGQRVPGIMQWQIIDEITSEDMGANRFAQHAVQYLKSTYPGARMHGWGDPSGDRRGEADEVTAFSVIQAAGLPIYPAPTNDPLRRREAVAGPLLQLGMTGKPSLIVSPKCITLRKGMNGGYHYARIQVSGDERFHDVPAKTFHSHVCEALQYLMVGEYMDFATSDKTINDDTPVRPPRVNTAINRGNRHGKR